MIIITVTVMVLVETAHSHIHKNVLSFSHHKTRTHVGAGTVEGTLPFAALSPCVPAYLAGMIMNAGCSQDKGPRDHSVGWLAGYWYRNAPFCMLSRLILSAC